MSKISELPEQELQYILMQLPVKRIMDLLHNQSDYSNGDKFIVQYDSDHPLFRLTYVTWNKNLKDKPDTKNLDLDYHDLLELIMIHYDRARGNDVLNMIEGNLKYGYVFTGYDEQGHPMFHFADDNTYKCIEAHKDNPRGEHYD